MTNERSLFRSLGIGFGGLILGLSFGVGQVLLAQTIEGAIEPVLVSETPIAFTLSREVATRADKIMASTSLDIQTATTLALDQISLEPQNQAVLKRLDTIISLLQTMIRIEKTK